MSACQRAFLIKVMREEYPEIKRGMDITWLRPIRWSPQERLGHFAQAKSALGSLTSTLDASFLDDLFDAAKTEQEEALIGDFLRLLSAVMELTNRITEKRIRERWAGADGRAARKEWTSIETDTVRHYVRHAGFCVDPPDTVALEVLRRILSFTNETVLSISAIRKRIAADDKRVAAEAKRDAEDEWIATGGKL